MIQRFLNDFDKEEDKSFLLFNIIHNYLLEIKKMTKEDLKNHLKEVYQIEYEDYELKSFLDCMTEDGFLKHWGSWYALSDFKIFN